MSKKKTFTIVIIGFLLTVILSTTPVLSQVEPPVVYDIEDKVTVNILENGDAKVTEVISMSAIAFATFRKEYPQLSMLTRLFKPRNIPIQIENLNIKVDEANNKLTATYTIKGAAVNRGKYWKVLLAAARGEKVTLSAQTEKSLVFTTSSYVTSEIREISTITINFPAEARNIKYLEDENKITYELPQPTPQRNVIFLVAGVVLIAAAIANIVLSKRARRPPPPPPPTPPPPPQ